jgi:hypothetical protein
MAEEGKTNVNGSLDFGSDAQGIEVCEESHPAPNNLELELVYVIRTPGVRDKSAPNSSLDRIYILFHTDCPHASRLTCALCLSNKDEPYGSRRLVGYVALSGSSFRWGRLSGGLQAN